MSTPVAGGSGGGGGGGDGEKPKRLDRFLRRASTFLRRDKSKRQSIAGTAPVVSEAGEGASAR